MEFVQIHPTALATPENPLALISNLSLGLKSIVVTPPSRVRFCWK
jgi:aspartate oxidase